MYIPRPISTDNIDVTRVFYRFVNVINTRGHWTTFELKYLLRFNIVNFFYYS